MQLSTICSRCQLRLLNREIRARSRSGRSFVSIATELPAQHNKRSQDEHDASWSKDGQRSTTREWTAHHTRTQDNSEPMKAVLEELFDATRHKAPATTSRYSRQLQFLPSRESNPVTKADVDQPSIQNDTQTTHFWPQSFPEYELSALTAVNHVQKRKDRLSPASLGQQPVQDPISEHHTTLVTEKDPWLTHITTQDKIYHRSRTHSDGAKSTAQESFSARWKNSGSNLSIRKAVRRSQPFFWQGSQSRNSDLDTRVTPITTSPDCASLLAPRAHLVKSMLPEADDGEQRPSLHGVTTVTSSGQQEPHTRSNSTTNMAQSVRDPYIKNSTKSGQFRLHVSQQNYKMTHELWDKFKEELDEGQHATEELSTLFADFLDGFVELRKLGPMNEVWKIMLQHGIKPKVRHYNALLTALLKNQEHNKFSAIWQDMTKNGIEPDNQSWITYISIAFKARDWQEALRIVDRMGSSWRMAIEKRTTVEQPSLEEQQYLPSIVPINATITGLLRLYLPRIAKDVVAWSDNFGIQRDTSTYNIFLRYACRHEGHEQAQSIIASMEKNDVKQDIITKTILLDSSIRNPNSLLFQRSPEEQEEIVLAELDRLFRGSERPSATTFAVIMHSLLHVAKPNLPAARAMFLLMLQYNIKVSPQIYTILFTHYFSMEKPDLEALDTLWSRIEKNGSKVDHILYDRMIEGYASIGEIGKMMLFFQKMTEKGLIPGWVALSQALLALAGKRRWDLCADFVMDVTKEGSHLRFGKRGWKGEKEFWQLVRELRDQHLIPNGR